MLLYTRSKDLLCWTPQELEAWGRWHVARSVWWVVCSMRMAAGGRWQVAGGRWPKSWHRSISESESWHLCAYRDEISRWLTVLVLTITAWESATKVDNGMLGRADLQFRFSISIYHRISMGTGLPASGQVLDQNNRTVRFQTCSTTWPAADGRRNRDLHMSICRCGRGWLDLSVPISDFTFWVSHFLIKFRYGTVNCKILSSVCQCLFWMHWLP